jgi:hypothetical protein
MNNTPEWSTIISEPNYPKTANYKKHGNISWPSCLNNPSYPFKFNNTLPNDYDKKEVMVTTKWCQGDDEERYKMSLQTQPSDWRYRNKEITYSMNRHGYRTKNWEDIDWKNSVVLLGDSCTFGIGVGEDETIGHFLEEQIDRPVVNLGVPGGSNHSMLENCVSMIHNYGIPYAVCATWSATDRFRYYTRIGYTDLGSWTSEKQNIGGVNFSDFRRDLFLEPENELAITYNISSTVQALLKYRCKYASASFFSTAAYSALADYWLPIDNGARDLAHPGAESMKKLSDFFYHKIKG